MPTMNVSLTAELADYVEQEVSTGDYASASEVVREALRMLRDERAVAEAKQRLLRDAVLMGWEQAERGELSDRTPDDIYEAVLSGREG